MRNEFQLKHISLTL